MFIDRLDPVELVFGRLIERSVFVFIQEADFIINSFINTAGFKRLVYACSQVLQLIYLLEQDISI